MDTRSFRPRPPRTTTNPTRPGPVPFDDHARDRVYSFLARGFRRFPDLDIRGPDTSGLEHRDAALAGAIHEAAVRHWSSLGVLIAHAADRPFRAIDPAPAGALLGASAQMIHLDRVPRHAAINHAVEWVKHRKNRGAGSFANAVLRKIDTLLASEPERPEHDPRARLDALPRSDGSWITLAQPILPDDQLARVSVQTGVPLWELERWDRAFSRERALDIAFWSLIHPPTILNIAHAREPVLLEGALEHDIPGHLVAPREHDRLADLLRARGDVWVQDPASSASLGLAADLGPSLIVDVCAGMGTKTRQLAAMFPGARVIATDTDAARRKVLGATFAGHPRVEVVKPGDLSEHNARADLVVLDVPCSNSGVLARRPEARHRLDGEHLRSLIDLQRQIIADAIPLLAPAGRILYATCSLDEEENRRQALWAGKWHGFRVEGESVRTPAGSPGSPSAYADGSYAVLLSSP